MTAAIDVRDLLVEPAGAVVGPDFAAVELGDEGARAVGGGAVVGGELGDLGFEGFVVGVEDGVCWRMCDAVGDKSNRAVTSADSPGAAWNTGPRLRLPY